MGRKLKIPLLSRYFGIGWLDRRYFDGKIYCQPYSAEERLLAGERFYSDYLAWFNRSAGARTSNYEMTPVDGGKMNDKLPVGGEAERFRAALRRISPQYLSVLYKIVLEEKEIRAPKEFQKREILYFNDEIKGILCRGLDELCRFYGRLS